MPFHFLHQIGGNFPITLFLPSCFPMTPHNERSIWQILAGNEWPSWALKQLIEAQLQGGELPLPRVFIESASDREPPLAVQSWTPYHMLSLHTICKLLCTVCHKGQPCTLGLTQYECIERGHHGIQRCTFYWRAPLAVIFRLVAAVVKLFRDW